MSESFEAVKITDNVYWVGAVDWGLRDFHGYLTNRGTTYNAYLVMADKITLIDTVKAPFKEELLARINSVVDPQKIRYIVSNHAETDHSGSLPDIIKAVQPEKVFASVMGAKALSEHYHRDLQFVPVKDTETLSLGNLNLSFVETRMVHWPDSMFTYLHEDHLLFSQDAFGMHLATSERFADEIDNSIMKQEAARYFANILLPLSLVIEKLLERVAGLGLNIGIIAPDHGPIWRKEPGTMVGLYARWCAQKPTKKAVVVYDTMWQSTATMARAIGEGLSAGGASVKMMPLKSCHRSDVAAEILEAGALIVGSPTMNNNIFPTVADVITYLKGLKPKNLIGAAFGSYGWSGEAVNQLNDILAGMKIDLVGEPLKVKYVPDGDALNRCYSLGLLIAGKLK
jgi:flavorubredoxin